MSEGVGKLHQTISSKIVFSKDINPKTTSGLTGMENVSLGEWEPESNTENFGRYFI